MGFTVESHYCLLYYSPIELYCTYSTLPLIALANGYTTNVNVTLKFSVQQIVRGALHRRRVGSLAHVVPVAVSVWSRLHLAAVRSCLGVVLRARGGHRLLRRQHVLPERQCEYRVYWASSNKWGEIWPILLSSPRPVNLAHGGHCQGDSINVHIDPLPLVRIWI